MLKSHNPYNILSEIISFENVQQMGEMITLKTLRGRYAYARQTLEWLYVGFVKDLNRSNDSHHVFSDAYDLAQTAICFLCEFVGKSLNMAGMTCNEIADFLDIDRITVWRRRTRAQVKYKTLFF